MMDDLAVLVDVPGTMRGRPVQPLTEIRVCSWCDTVLSRYNPTEWCSVHESVARRALNLFDGVSRGHVRELDAQSSERPLFRCDSCEGIWPIAYQWLTDHYRFCAWCKPANAVRSDALELAC